MYIPMVAVLVLMYAVIDRRDGSFIHKYLYHGFSACTDVVIDQRNSFFIHTYIPMDMVAVLVLML